MSAAEDTEALKEFAMIVLVVIGLLVSVLILAATPYAFFILWAIGRDEPGAGHCYAWLTLIPAVAIILL